MRRLVPVPVLLALVGCTGGGGGGAPAPNQPKLEAVTFVGNRVCGNFATLNETFFFNCPPLPTNEGSGWQLTPVWRVSPTPTNPMRQVINRTVTLKVSAPSLTELDVELAQLQHVPNVPLTAVDPTRPGSPGEVGMTRQIGVTTSDDGTTKIWILEVNVSPCADYRNLQMFNRSNGIRNANPLTVHLLRDPADQACGGSAGVSIGVSSCQNCPGHAGPGDPGHPKPPGPCAGGAPEQVFDVCETCSAGIGVYTGFSACTWNDVLAIFNKPLCTQRQANRATCEGI